MDCLRWHVAFASARPRKWGGSNPCEDYDCLRGVRQRRSIFHPSKGQGTPTGPWAVPLLDCRRLRAPSDEAHAKNAHDAHNDNSNCLLEVRRMDRGQGFLHGGKTRLPPDRQRVPDPLLAHGRKTDRSCPSSIPERKHSAAARFDRVSPAGCSFGSAGRACSRQPVEYSGNSGNPSRRVAERNFVGRPRDSRPGASTVPRRHIVVKPLCRERPGAEKGPGLGRILSYAVEFTYSSIFVDPNWGAGT